MSMTELVSRNRGMAETLKLNLSLNNMWKQNFALKYIQITSDLMPKNYCTTLCLHEYYMSQHTSNPLLMTTGSVVMQQVVVPQASGHSALSSLI